MGTTCFQNPVGKPTVDVIRDEFGDGITFHAHATTNGAFYAAAEVSSRPGSIWGLVVKVDRRGGDFCYKDMEEGMGPVESHAPAKVLNLLSPVEELYGDGDSARWAQAWRDRCWANITRREMAKAVKPGMRIRFDAPMEFTDGVERQEFTFIGRSRFRADDGAQVNVTSWRTRTDWQVVTTSSQRQATLAT